MQDNRYIEGLNIVGAVCSILALMITLSRNPTFELIIKIFFVILFIIAVGGVLYRWADNVRRLWIKSSYWPYSLTFWLVSFIIIVIILMFVGGTAYYLADMFFEAMGSIFKNL